MELFLSFPCGCRADAEIIGKPTEPIENWMMTIICDEHMRTIKMVMP
ncbi:MAG: hypothetical protein ACYTEQ_24845 [Planctomycetota bacterium]|jgi:hypothetical protein